MLPTVYNPNSLEMH